MIYGNTFLKEEYEYINISAVEVKSFLNELSKIEIDQSIMEQYNTPFVYNEQFLFEATGIKKSDIDAKAKPAGQKIAKVIKEKGINAESKKDIKRIYDDFISELSKQASINIDSICGDINYKKNKDKYKISNIIKAAEVTLFASAINGLMLAILMCIVPHFANIILGCIVAPIVEETAKAVATKGGYAAEFAVVFNAFEFTSYVTKYSSVTGIITTRLKVVAMHCTTSIIHWLTSNEEIQKKLKLTKEEDKQKLKFLGRILGVLIHAGWNTIGTFKPEIIAPEIAKAVE